MEPGQIWDHWYKKYVNKFSNTFFGERRVGPIGPVFFKKLGGLRRGTSSFVENVGLGFFFQISQF